MEELKIPSASYTPEVILNPGGTVRIKGRSIDENITEFYQPVYSWLEEYVKEPADVTFVDINLEYFNSASSKILIRLLQQISRVQFMHKKFIINWYYEDGDEDVLEKGEYFSSVLRMPFNFVKVT
jgi:hypothetical protein